MSRHDPKTSQIALPLVTGQQNGPASIVVGNANAHVIEALRAPQKWPFGTAILTGPERSGKSLLADWFAGQDLGSCVDDADRVDETVLFHRWNTAQEQSRPLLLVSNAPKWEIALADLSSRLGAALLLEIGAPDDAMLASLIESHAQQRGLALAAGAMDYLVPRLERSFAAVESCVAAIDRLSLERKVPATQSIWRAALDVAQGPEQSRLL